MKGLQRMATKKVKKKGKKTANKKAQGDFFSELKSDGAKFHSMMEAYFRELNTDESLVNVLKVTPTPTSIGTDLGQDILVTFEMEDSIKSFTRKWVVQCKFHNKNISPKEILSVNIPSLIASHGANGYLLLCRKYPTSGTAELFKNLAKETPFGYEIWTGDVIASKLIPRADTLLKQFMPKQYNKLKKK